MKSLAIAAILSSLNDELGRLQDKRPARYLMTEEWEPTRVALQAYLAVGKIKAEDVDHERLARLNGEGGALTCNHRSFAEHPDRCMCQGDEVTPHRHYDRAPYRCARCGRCEAYSPAVVAEPAPPLRPIRGETTERR